MVTTKKPKGITITVRDRRENESKSLTVYNTSLEEIYEKIEKAFNKE